jgi:hypothetical protein
MLGMEFKLNRERIEKEEKDKTYKNMIYSLDKYFRKYGFDAYEEDDARRYLGHDHPDDLAMLGVIRTRLINTRWFMENLHYWYLLDSDDNDDPNDFNYEDILSTLMEDNNLKWLDPKNIKPKEGITAI